MCPTVDRLPERPCGVGQREGASVRAHNRSGAEARGHERDNQWIQRLAPMGLVQRQAGVTQSRDPLEAEADRIAASMLNDRPISPSSVTSAASGAQRMCTRCAGEEEEPAVQRNPRGRDPMASGDRRGPVPRVSGGGTPLTPGLRRYFEPRLGRRLGDVRLHTDHAAARSAESIAAEAYTAGRDIVFGHGTFRPETPSGRHLIAHELVHVVQQSRAGGNLAIQRSCRDNRDPSFYARAPNYCRDTSFSGMFHTGQTCYREVPRRSSYLECPPGDQVCFDAEGHCRDSYDEASPVESRNADGSCNLHHVCTWTSHTVEDVLPGLWHEATDPIFDELGKATDWRNWLPLLRPWL